MYKMNPVIISLFSLKAWNAMEAKFADDFTDKKTEADDKWKASLKEFHDVCRDLLKVHKRAREVGDYDEAPFLNALIDISTDADEEFADCCAFITGGFHTSGNLLTWCVNHSKIFLSIAPKASC